MNFKRVVIIAIAILITLGVGIIAFSVTRPSKEPTTEETTLDKSQLFKLTNETLRKIGTSKGVPYDRPMAIDGEVQYFESDWLLVDVDLLDEAPSSPDRGIRLLLKRDGQKLTLIDYAYDWFQRDTLPADTPYEIVERYSL